MPTTEQWIQIATLVGVFVGLYVSYKNGRRISKVHLTVNSRMDQLLLAKTEISHAEGKAEGKIEGIKGVTGL